MLKFKRIIFCSNTSISERALVAGLGGLNLFGVIILGAILKYVGFELCHCLVVFVYILF